MVKSTKPVTIYRFTHSHHNSCYFIPSQELTETKSGSCRSEALTTRKPTEMFSFIDSRYRKKPVGLTPGVASTAESSDLTHTSSR